MKWLLLIAMCASCGCESQRHVELVVHERGSSRVAETIVGQMCRVQLRRDALGMASNTGQSTNDAWAKRLSLSGKVLQVTDQWVVISGEAGKPICIAQSAILIVEVLD